MRELPFVEVEWNDAVASGSWEDEEGLVAPGVNYSRGWLVKETPEYLVLAMTVGDEGEEDVLGTCAILKASIRRRRKLKVSYGR